MTPSPQRLPANTDAERFTLGTILLDDSFYGQVAGVLVPDDFSLEKHRRIFRRMGDLYSRGEKIDRVTLANELDRLHELEAVDGLSYLVSLDDAMPQLPNIDSYIKIVKDKSLKRRLIATSDHILKSASAEIDDGNTILAAAEDSFFRLREGQADSRCWSGPELISRVLARARARKRQFEETGEPVMGVRSGFVRLDKLLNGFDVGLHLLAAQTGVGKTSFCTQIAGYACQHGTPVVYVSYENSPDNLQQKIICLRSGVDSRSIDRGDAHSNQFKRFEDAAAELTGPMSPLRVIQGSMSLQLAEVRAAAEKLKRQHNTNTCLVIFDYLQRAAAAQGYNDMRANVSGLTAHLSDLANRLESPVLAISSQNRALAGKPELASFKESSEMEYGCTTAMFLCASSDRMAIPPAEAIDLTIAKQRFGPLGKVPFIFRGDLGQFREEEAAAAGRAS